MIMNIGILIPDKLEYKPFYEYALSQNGQKVQDEYYDVCSLEINDKKIYLLRCEIGKVRSAAATAYLINKYETEVVINAGLAGSPFNRIEKGSVCVGSKYIEADFDLTALSYKLGEKSDRTYFNSADPKLLKLATKECNLLSGIIASGDFFLNDEKKSKFLINEFDLSVFDMESAAVADICKIYNIPFISVRKISDDGSESAKADYGRENEGKKKDLVAAVFDLIEKI